MRESRKQLRAPIAIFLTIFTLTSIFSIRASSASPQIVHDQNSPIFSTLHIPTYTWLKQNTSPRAIIIGLHGGCLHGRSYQALAEALAEKNYMFVSFDMRGFGKWYYEGYGTKKDMTFNYSQTKKDLSVLVSKLRAAFPHAPIFLIGESLGSNLALLMLGGFQHLTDGGILVSTYASPSHIASRALPLSVAQFLTNPFCKLTMVPYIKDRLSDNPDWSDDQINDPRGRDYQNVKEMIKSMVVNHSGKNYATQIPADTPVLVLHGERDQLCNPDAAHKLFESMPSQDKQFIYIQNSGHLIVETPHMRPDVLETIDTWLSAHSKPLLEHIQARAHQLQQVGLN